MRNWLAVLVLLCGACGSAAKPTDGAITDSPFGPELGMSFPDMDPCGYWAGQQFSADAAACTPVPEYAAVYDLRLGVDAGACESRPTVPCDEACGPGPTLYSQVIRLLGKCLAGESAFVVTFSQGCADRLHLETPYYRPDEIAACVEQALSPSRFACAEQVPCWQWSYSTLALP
jgi:hypothetical protein